MNTATGTGTIHALEVNRFGYRGRLLSRSPTTPSTSNLDVPINLSPNRHLGRRPPASRSLSGDPFIHGNVFTGNDFNGVGIQGGTGNGVQNGSGNDQQTTVFANAPNLDRQLGLDRAATYTYILRDTIVLGPENGFFLPIPSSTQLLAEPTPVVTLTLQSTLPGTVLADGTVVPAPGVPLIIKLLNVGSTPLAQSDRATPAAAVRNSILQGAGFIVGVDNGIEPDHRLLDRPGCVQPDPDHSESGPTSPPARVGSRSSSPRSTTAPWARPSIMSR